ncbi:MAG: MotA/TolQ/ExbB proton channel family protein [Coprobacter sp.]|nr:MotA/TolQ/ExbB proton channel family protein [Coprobacter sp.]
METKKPQAPKAKKESKGFRGIESAFAVIVCCLVVALIVFNYVLGNPENFEGGDPVKGHPINMLGTIYKGGFIVPILQTLFLTVIVLSIERAFALVTAKGKGSMSKFVINVKAALAANDIAKAQEYCNKQKGCVGSVVSSALKKYAEVEANDEMSKEQKLVAIQKEVEEATALELPTLEMNLAVVATMTTLGTLVGLLGTVLGMIKSFSALATSTGAPDSVALSTGISEALVNTAFGIATGALAVISYNFFTSKIDKITYAIDEIGFSIVQSYAANHSK